MNLKEQILTLTGISGISGGEFPVRQYLEERLQKLNMNPEVDENGNLFGTLRCKQKNAKTILLEAHMDRIGFMVSGIENDGSLRFVTVGGVDERILPGLEVLVEGKELCPGVVVLKETKEKDKNPKCQNFRIETGWNQEETEKRISVGDFIGMVSDSVELLGEKLSGGAMDNRAGIGAVLCCLEQLQGKELPYHLQVLFSTGEETGLQGAYTANLSADAAIVIDVTHGMTPDTKEEVGVFPLGSGAVICRGPNLHYDYTKQLLALAKERGIPYAIEVAAGSSGTTAWAIQTANGGIPCMLVSIPLRYMHTNLETLAVSDVQAVSELLVSAVMGGISLA